jgi:ATP-dependent Clp protease protease subunit
MAENLNRLDDIITKQLLDDRKVFLWGQVDDDSAKGVIEKMLYLDSVSDKEIEFVINSPGGYVTAGFAIHDTMKSLKSPISTVCMGLAASMGSILLSAGDKGRRKMQPLARVMIHQPSSGVRGQFSDIEIQAKELQKTKEVSAKILADNCGQEYDKVFKDFDRDFWMDAEESKKYGIIDEVVE